MSYVIATSRKWYEGMAPRLSQATGQQFHLLTDRAELTVPTLDALQPKYVFFPHWSYIIPKEIFARFQCVIFHMTDLPFGRGGSPLQNLIARGIYETKVSAIRCAAELDGGDVFLKRPLSLHGAAEEIYLRAADLIETMIAEISMTEPEPVPQQGEVVCFPRRKPEQSDLGGLTELKQVFDHIRMLDAEGYPNAFLEVGGFRFEFTRAALKEGKVVADVTITKKG